MAKFCTKCGKPLVDGKPCSCSLKEEKKQEKVEVEEEETSTNEVVASITDIYKNVWKKPYQTMVKYKEKNITLGLCLILINAVIFGIFGYFLINNTYNGILEDISNKLQGVAALTGEEIEVFQRTSLPFFGMFISNVISLAIGYLILISISRLFVGKIFKGKGTFGDYLTAAGVASPLSTIVMVVGILASFISYKLAILIAILATITFFVLLSQAYVDILEAKEERLAYSQSLTLVSTYVISVIVGIILLSAMTFQQLTNTTSQTTSNPMFGNSVYIVK